MIYTNRFQSPLGEILLAADDEGLTGLWFMENQKYKGLGMSANAVECDLPVFDETGKWLDIYFSGRDPGFTPDLHLGAVLKEKLRFSSWRRTVIFR